jgi:hypothetical protein
MVACKLPLWLKLPENTRACLEKVFMKQTLVEASIPPTDVEMRQCVAAVFHAVEGGLFSLRGSGGKALPLLFGQ